MYISKTPLRVSLFGGGTDYPEYFAENPSAVLGGTINKYIYTTAVDLAPFSEQRFRLSYRVVEDCDTIEEISHPVIRETLKDKQYTIPTGFYTVSDLPGGTGLGSSSSFTVGFLNLISYLQKNKVLDPYTLAKEAIRIERDILHENVGVQDQTHAAYGGLCSYDFAKQNIGVSITRKRVNISKDSKDMLNQSMILVYTNIQRHASKIVSSQIEHIKQGSNTNYLNTMYDMVDEAKNILKHKGNAEEMLGTLGRLLNQSWDLKQNLGKGISNPTINNIYHTGIDMGAWGGKLLGAGGGGFVMFLLDPALIPKFRKEFGENNVIPVSFTDHGSVIETV